MPDPKPADEVGITKPLWITDHSLIDDNASYIVCAIASRPDKSTYLYSPRVVKGWQFKQSLPDCYAGIPMPEWRNQW